MAGEKILGEKSRGVMLINFLKTKLPTGKSKCLKLRFKNVDVNENVLISKYELEIAAPFKTGDKRMKFNLVSAKNCYRLG